MSAGYADIEDTLCQAFEAGLAELFQRVGPAFEEPTWREGIRAVAYTVFEFVVEDRSRAQLMFVDSLAAGERATLLREQGLDLLVQMIDQGRQELEEPDSVSTATAQAIGGTIYTQIRLAVARDAVEPDLVPKLLYNVVLPYLGTEAAEEELKRLPPPGTSMSFSS